MRQGGKRVLRVPLKAVLHAEHAMVAPGLREYLQSTRVDDLDALAIFLIRERADPTSPWSVISMHRTAQGWLDIVTHACRAACRRPRHVRYPYLNVLPTNFTTPVYYTPEELELLKGSVTYDYAVNREQAIRRKYREHRDAILDGFPDGAHHSAPPASRWQKAHVDVTSNPRNECFTVFKDPSLFTYENFKWALSVQWSRLLRTKVRGAYACPIRESVANMGNPRRVLPLVVGQGRRRLARCCHPRAARRLYQYGHAQGD